MWPHLQTRRTSGDVNGPLVRIRRMDPGERGSRRAQGREGMKGERASRRAQAPKGVTEALGRPA